MSRRSVRPPQVGHRRREAARKGRVALLDAAWACGRVESRMRLSRDHAEDLEWILEQLSAGQVGDAAGIARAMAAEARRSERLLLDWIDRIARDDD